MAFMRSMSMICRGLPCHCVNGRAGQIPDMPNLPRRQSDTSVVFKGGIDKGLSHRLAIARGTP